VLPLQLIQPNQLNNNYSATREMLAGGNTGRPNPHQGYQFANFREYAIEKVQTGISRILQIFSNL